MFPFQAHNTKFMFSEHQVDLDSQSLPNLHFSAAFKVIQLLLIILRAFDGDWGLLFFFFFIEGVIVVKYSTS